MPRKVPTCITMLSPEVNVLTPKSTSVNFLPLPELFGLRTLMRVCKVLSVGVGGSEGFHARGPCAGEFNPFNPFFDIEYLGATQTSRPLVF